MRKILIAAAVLSAFSIPVFAETYPVPEAWQVVEKVELKDGNYVNVYRDGKMAMESRFGHTLTMTPGHGMQTKDGRTLTMVGNETFRVELHNPLLSPAATF